MHPATQDAPAVTPPPDTWVLVRRVAVAIVIVAVVWRIIRYAMGFPIWGDEAGLMLNVAFAKSYADLFKPLDNSQVAPIGFLAAQFSAMHHLGTSVFSLRLFPLITGVAAVFAFAKLARLTLSPLAAAFATGALLGAHYTTRYALDIKPYGTDLLASSLLLVLAALWIQHPDQLRRPITLILLAPVTLAFSFPAVFVAGAIGITLAVVLFRAKAKPAQWMLLAIYLAAVGGTFLLLLTMSMSDQYQHTHEAMVRYWARGFPPDQLWKFPIWLLDVHTAEMMCYPFGGKNGAGSLTFALFAIGIYAVARRGNRTWLMLFLSIFALTLIASILRRYPYGGSARVAQHLAPAIAIFAGAGVEFLILGIKSPAKQRHAANIVVCVFLIFAIGGTVRDIAKPYQTHVDKDIASHFAEFKRRLDPGAGVAVLDGYEPLSWNVRWFVLDAMDFNPDRAVQGPLDPRALATKSDWWLLNCDPRRPEISLPGFERTYRSQDVYPRDPLDRIGKITVLERWQKPVESSRP